MTTLPESILEEFGANAEYVAELYAQWRYSPVTVSEEWRRYFESLDGEPLVEGDGDRARSNGGATATAEPAAEPTRARATTVPTKLEPADIEEALPPTGVVSPAALVNPELEAYEEAQPIRGVAALIVENMETSLGLPTATSYRFVPVKVLEENRRVINDTLKPKGIKVSYTHLIAWAIVEALEEFPQLNTAYAFIDGKPHRILRHDVNLGVAIDIERKDGTRSLIVPNVKGVNHMDFKGFMDAFSDLIERARDGKLTTEDYQGTSITLTNPGTIGTIISVPRLMAGQGTIVATGAITFPAEYSATDPDVLTEIGVSKVMGLSSTYDHRIIQGAESGMFLAKIHRLLVGEDAFYDRIFRSLLIPYPPVRWAQDNKPMLLSGPPGMAAAEKEASVLQLIRAYRVRGHLLADLNPLTNEPKEYHPDLDPATYGLTLWDLDREFITGGLAGMKRATLRKILDILRHSYSGHVGVEYMNIQDPEERRWLQQQVERAKPLDPLPMERRREILDSLSKAEAFEQFLHRRYVGSKRFSLEGAEATIPLLETVLDRAAEQGIEEAVMGMAHRGRLNVLKNIMQKSARAIFSEFEGSIDPESTQGTGDVKYHLGAHGIRRCPGDYEIELTLASNPSHLEAVDPVVEGMAHARQRLRVKGLEGLAMDEVLPVLIHGDAAFAGQGVVAETLNLAQLRGYRTGGTIHLIINNQIGFTTEPSDARSTPFPTDIAKMSQVPIFHVNGDDPEAVVRVAEIALDYRNTFHKDVVIDLITYRRWGHNEGDDPSFTQPRMYKLIEKRNSPREVYAQQLLREGVIAQEDAQEMYDSAMEQLEAGTQGLTELPEPEVDLEYDESLDLALGEPPQTAVDQDTLIHISKVLANPPEEFVGHPKLLRLLQRRELKGDGSDQIDWATAELLAFGTLLLEKHPVRLSGQDSARGTFSQRHSVLHNYEKDEEYVPLNHLAEEQAPFRVWDSMLSEEAVVGFEFGYSLAAPDTLVLWEAQFGDFANGAQVMVDQFISSSAVKWNRYSDLVMLLPHGYEGQGPEHSSARVERYLQLCAEDNMKVAVPSTPANYFHLLRRQKHDEVQRPLIVLTPKSLLRLPAAASKLDEFTSGNFQYVIDDPAVEDPSKVRKLVFLSGKLYYDILTNREGRDDLALVRVEQLYPYPRAAIRGILERYPNATEVIWAQEEPRNHGAWDFIKPFLRDDLRDSEPHKEITLRYIGRPPAASPATGSFKVHQQEQAAIVEAILET
ncbi:MAG: multifunctional oxoglutarate decarboxylase/oxoglutarate dehydrogenase thiamine pyrophosphate-binding subunit/dihydrolipoyllysine-residue succinyltransferase subunit [Chloroflexota bacterium]|nr:multifunctional oxoglutarate decarboxylase/oxoglutarate dehydrogenase thiamine pyrophosphate-binding subunit/dihydrolipoyllysine-residue succinyltransferase subunit [Chloroflexota bacterium]